MFLLAQLECYAAVFVFAETGLAALENWGQYDMEPVEGGLVEPGWICLPAPLIRKVAKETTDG